MVYIYHNLANISTEKKENSGKSSVKVNKCLLKKKLDGRSELHVHNEKHGFISHMKIFSACTKIVINFGVSSVLCCFIRDVLYEYIYIY